jgi:xylulokinase
MISDVEAGYDGPGSLLALPYLAGERTPHNDTAARGAFIGMTATSERRDFALAMMEAVAFSLRDGLEALSAAVPVPESLTLIGGGSGSTFWAQMLATVLDRDLEIGDASGRGPAFGAARLAMVGAGGHSSGEVFHAPPVLSRLAPDPVLGAAYAGRIERFRALYKALAPEFRALMAGAAASGGRRATDPHQPL